MDESIAKIIEEALSEVTGRPVEGIGPQTRFDRDFDIDSYMFVQFLLTLEDKIEGLRFDPDAIGQHEFNVVGSLVAYVLERTGAAAAHDHA